jgi:16S rRNA (guanine1516-N2)-methyltransferase
MPRPPPPVVAADDPSRALAESVADTLSAPLLPRAAWAEGRVALVVWCDQAGVGLRGPAASRALPVRPSPPAARAGRDPLVRAVGSGRSVIDATGGFAADAGTLVAAGCPVDLIERDPVMALILRDAIDRWIGAGLIPPDRLRLHHGDARELLLSLRAEVVTLDPMYPLPASIHPPRKGEALHLLRALLGDDGDQAGLLPLARRAASARVVVKRPRVAPYLACVAPSGSIGGRSVRYDLYAPEEDARERER